MNIDSGTFSLRFSTQTALIDIFGQFGAFFKNGTPEYLCLIFAIFVEYLRSVLTNTCALLIQLFATRKRTRQTREIMLRSTLRQIPNRKSGRIVKRHWVRPGRNTLWWDNILSGISVEDEWRENFCITRETFNCLCTELSPYLFKQETNMRKPVSVQTQIAVTLYYLSDEGRLRKVANAFGLGRSSIINNQTGNISYFIPPWTKIYKTAHNSR